MSGLIPHVIIALISAIVVHIIHFQWRYSLAILFGNLLPDIIKFGLAAARQGTLNIFSINYDSFYWFWDTATHVNYANWFVLGFFVFATAGYMYHFHYIKKKTMEDYDLLYVFLIIGVFIHIIMDVIFVENGPWI